MRGVGFIVPFALVLGATCARAQSAAEFFKGRTLTLTISSEVGGGYDHYGRLLARYMPKYLPGSPTIVPKNMPGAGGVVATERMAHVAPRDGSEFAIAYRGIVVLPLLGLTSSFDVTKFTWIGSPSKETAVCLMWHTSAIKTFADAQQKPAILGSTARGADLTSFTQPLVNVLGAKFKLVTGYKGGPALNLAMERGEIDGRCGVSWTSLVTQQPRWLRDKLVNVIIQLGFERRPELPDVPLAQELAKSDEDRQVLELLLTPQLIAYPFFAPPGVPKDRAQALRDAFDAAVKDPGLLAEAAKQKMEIEPVSGVQIESVLKKMYASSPQMVERARRAVR